MLLYRAVANLPLTATAAYETFWKNLQEVLKTCPGNIGAGTGIGLWSSMAYPF